MLVIDNKRLTVGETFVAINETDKCATELCSFNNCNYPVQY